MAEQGAAARDGTRFVRNLQTFRGLSRRLVRDIQGRSRRPERADGAGIELVVALKLAVLVSALKSQGELRKTAALPNKSAGATGSLG